MAESLTHQIRCDRCNQPMAWRGGRTRWEGDYEHSEYRYECPHACQVEATVTYRTLIPIDVAQIRPE